VVELPPEIYNNFDPRELTGTPVSIDGDYYIVKGVETYAVPWVGGSTIFKNVGLLV
jgi:hypothetical protein